MGNKLHREHHQETKHDNLPVDVSKPNILILTGNSQTGSHTISNLMKHFANQVNVRAAVRDKSKSKAFDKYKNDLEVVWGVDATNLESMKKAFAGIDRALIVPPNTEDRGRLTCMMIDAAKFYGVQHIVLISAYGAEEEEASMIGKEFRLMEIHAEKSGMLYTFLRSTPFMENLLGSADSIKKSGELYGCTGEKGVPFVAIDDLGRMAAFVLASQGTTHHNKAYNLTGTETLNNAQIAQIFTSQMNHPVKYVDVGDEGMRKILSGTFEEWQLKAYLDLLRWYRTNQTPPSKDIREVTGAHTSLAEWIRMHDRAFVRSHSWL